MDFDANVANYTTADLLQLAGLSNADLYDRNEIIKQTANRISQYPKVANFWQEVQNALLHFSTQLNEGATASAPVPADQAANWFQNEALKQSNDVQNDKITERKQKIDVFGSPQVPMERQQLGVNNVHSVPVVQDKLNPNLRNNTQRIINLDSQFRDPDSLTSSTNYTLNLADTISNAYSMRLYSFQIPFTWYVIDVVYGNTCLWVVSDAGEYVAVSVPSGNYSNTDFIIALNDAFTTAGFVFGSGGPATFDSHNGKITLTAYGGTFSGLDIYGNTVSFSVTATTQILFFDFTSTVTCTDVCQSLGSHYLNQTLGWLMGFRVPFIYCDPSGNVASAVVDLNGPKYLLLSIDDFCQNHVNHGLVTITQLDRHFKLPSYFTPNMPYTCLAAIRDRREALNTIVDETNDGLIIGSKFNNEYTATMQVLPSAPRVITQAQLYTINQINQVNNNNTNYLAKAPTSPDILALLPVKTNGLAIGGLISENSGSLQDNIRNYFGPVHIKRLGVRLLDDKGNVLNLNGCDWNVTLIFDCLYQY